MLTLATCAASVPGRARPARTSFSRAARNASHGPKRRFVSRSRRTAAIEESVHWIWRWSSWK